MYCHKILELLLSDAVTAWECEEPKIWGEKRVFLCLFHLWKENMCDICTDELLSKGFEKSAIHTRAYSAESPPDSILKIETQLTLFYLPLY